MLHYDEPTQSGRKLLVSIVQDTVAFLLVFGGLFWLLLCVVEEQPFPFK